MDVQYYVPKDGHQFGPMSKNELLNSVHQQQFTHSDMVWTEGRDWTPISALFPPQPANRPVPPPLPVATSVGAKWVAGCAGIAGLLILGFIGLIILAAIFDRGDSSSSVVANTPSLPTEETVPSTPQDTPAKPAPDAAKSKNAYSVGESFTLGSFRYQILSATKSYTLQSVFEGGLSQEEIFGKMLTQKFGPQSNGPAYVIIRYSLTNVGQEEDDALTDDFKIVDSKGRKFSMRSEETSVVSGEVLPILTLQPGIPQNAVQVFQLPKDAFDQDLTLIVPTTKMFSSEEAKVAIGKSISAQATEGKPQN